MNPSSFALGLIAGLSCCMVIWPVVPLPRKSKEIFVSRPFSTTQSSTLHAVVTAYCPCKKCCGIHADGKTALGRDAFKTRGVAVAWDLIPKWSKVMIPGIGTFVADDTGGAMRQDAKRGIVHIDLRFSDHRDAMRWGIKEFDVIVSQ